jgi:hypothetical protein
MRLRRRFTIFSLLMLCCATSASAQGFGREWFEKLSGPGPFRGTGIEVPIGCQWSDHRFLWYFRTPEAMASPEKTRGGVTPLAQDATRRFCIDLQYTAQSNKDSGTVGLIALRTIDVRFGIPLEKGGGPWYWTAAFEPSLAAGAIQFEGDAFNEWRFTLSPEITVKPLKLIPTRRGKIPNRRGNWRGLIEFAAGAVFIAPPIGNADLHVEQLETFEHGWLKRIALRVNLSELVGLR